MATQQQKLQEALLERYRIIEEVGRGGMATVFLAEDLKNRRRVAVKLLREEVGSIVGPERFLREIEIAASLNHPNILALYDSGDAAGVPYYVMPFVEGPTLRQKLDHEQQLSLEQALVITQEIADALSYAHHRDILHRDIKPENILFQAQHALVSDFGVARAISASAADRLTGSGIALGTPAYMSPEQASGVDHLDVRSDLYSLACVLYEMLAGEPPFTGPNAQVIHARHAFDSVPPLRTVRSVPARVERAIMKALEKIPADRFSTVQEFVLALWTPESLAPRSVRGLGLSHGTGDFSTAGIATPRPRDDEIDVFGMTHPGMVRRENSDHFLLYSLRRRVVTLLSSLPGNHAAALEAERLALVAMVADGFGDETDSAVSNRIAMEMITEYIARSVHCCYSADLEDEHTFAATLQKAAERLHAELLVKHSRTTTSRPSLTLWIGVWPRAYLLQIGASRSFVLRNGLLTQLTGPGATHPSTDSRVDVSLPTVTKMQQSWDDVGLLCTDGLVDYVSTERIRQCLVSTVSAKEGCERLIQEALKGGGGDNVTVLVGRARQRQSA